MLQQPCNGWRLHEELPHQVCNGLRYNGAYRTDWPEAWAQPSRCFQEVPQVQPHSLTTRWEARDVEGSFDPRLGTKEVDAWGQLNPREVRPPWPSTCKCRANSSTSGRFCATYREGAKMYAADQKSFQQSAAMRLKALELEHQELRKQINQQLYPSHQRQEKVGKTNHQDLRCEGSCGSRCATKARSRSVCGGAGPQGQQGRSVGTGRQERSAREVMQINPNPTQSVQGALQQKVEAARYLTPTVPLVDQRTQNYGQLRNTQGGLVSQDYDWAHPVSYQDLQKAQPEYPPAPPPAPVAPGMPDLTQMPRAVCPTPYALGSVCGRGERELPAWRSCKDSNEILGTCSEILTSTARYIFDVVKSRDVNRQGMLKILSAADGCADDTIQEAQARYVPTSVMLAHAFAASTGGWSDYRTKIRVYGGDVRNAIMPYWQPQALPWQLPIFLEHRFIALDNTKDFAPQLYNGQCEAGQLFDVVLLRQGLCFCDDPSKVASSWPLEVRLSCKSCINCRAVLPPESLPQQDPATVRRTAICGVYRLEPFLCENRAAYRLGRCVLRWCPERLEWAVLDDADGGAWAYARGDLGHPILSRGPWTVWDGQNHISDASFACNLVHEAASPPWHLLPQQRMVCAGVTGDSESVIRLLSRVAAILDASKPDSFGLLHGAWTNGTQVEVEQLHRQLTEAVQMYNDRRAAAGGFPAHAACVLWRTAATQYWLQCDGIMLFQPGSCADPYRAYGSAALI